MLDYTDRGNIHQEYQMKIDTPKDSDNFVYNHFKEHASGTKATYCCVKKRSLKCPATTTYNHEHNIISG